MQRPLANDPDWNQHLATRAFDPTIGWQREVERNASRALTRPLDDKTLDPTVNPRRLLPFQAHD
ncbi:hypothetical protein BA059_08835 [Mycolicibacterium sp. (ex Dasyatis americana)]|nr:hypothetical protein BA059_08835 [Mycolicibacterium sp. (ex Dasyatis americana)]